MYSKLINPSIFVPAHYSFPSGHSTQAHLVTKVLKNLFGANEPSIRNLDQMHGRLEQIALDVPQNREWAGVHYASDTEAGKALAEEIERRCFPEIDQPLESIFKDLLVKAGSEW